MLVIVMAVDELLEEGRLCELDATLRLKLYDYCTAVARESHRQIRLADEQLMLLEDKGQSGVHVTVVLGYLLVL